MKNPIKVHKHLIIRAEANKVPTDEEQLTEWLKEFIDSIHMKILMGPYVKYCNVEGNRGITGIAVIETSHIAIHVWDEPNPALMQIDVYSCAEFDVDQIAEKIKADFIPTKKNSPAETFLPNYGFKKENEYWVYDLNNPVKSPNHLLLEVE